MMHTMLGRDLFRRGMDEYVRRHDNQAATIEDFVAALSAGGGLDLSEFLAWYGQAGTPVVTMRDRYDPAARRYHLTLSQQTQASAGQPDKRPLPIPIPAGLLAPDGRELATRLLVLREAEQDFVFDDIPAPPVPSLLRGFSAPVRLAGLSQDQLRFLAAHDTDPFTRWDSFQHYALGVIARQVGTYRPDAPIALDDGLLEALRTTLQRADADPAFAAEMLTLPAASTIAAELPVERWEPIHAIRESLRTQIGERLEAALRAMYEQLADAGPYRIDGLSIGRRALRNACLRYLAAAGADGLALAQAQFDARRNMTDVLCALSVLSLGEAAGREPALQAFYHRWRHDPLVLDKWFAIQAESLRPQTLQEVRLLYRHPDFSLRNPNRIRALVGTFAHANPLRFHDASGAGYAFLTDVLAELDPINGQAAARLMGPLSTWRRQEPARAQMMRGQLQRLQALPGLSRWTAEKVALALKE